MAVSRPWRDCSEVPGTTWAIVSQFLLGCSVSRPVGSRSRAWGPSLRWKWTRKGARNSASSGSGVLGACGIRVVFIPVLRPKLNQGSADKVVLVARGPSGCLRDPTRHIAAVPQEFLLVLGAEQR